MLLEGGVHCVWGKIQAIGPCDGAEVNLSFCEAIGIGEVGEDASFGRMDEGGHIDRSGGTVKEPDGETVVAFRANLFDVVGVIADDRRRQGSGAICEGCALSSHSLQFSSSSA